MEFDSRNAQHAYLRGLQEWCAQRQKARELALAEKTKPLHLKINDWWENSPETQMKDRYTMHELVQRFRYPAGQIGEALHMLGWERKRTWKAGAPYKRYWVRKR